MKILLPFVILVLVHHFLLVPLIRKKLPLYIGLTAALLVLFGVWCFTFERQQGGPPPPQREFEQAPPPPPVHERGDHRPEGRP
ncbi:MAG: hypothetical protein IIU16_00225, partial [Bacteroidales bacterium]|nr:hypothetical protein [Bacteroidales bacterium]